MSDAAPTLDYAVAAAGGWLPGTFARALETRQLEVEQDRVETKLELL